MAELTQVLAAAEAGDSHAAAELLPLVYDELRKLAAARMAAEAPGQTLQATALVHEAYLRLVMGGGGDAPSSQHWNGRGHFFAAAAEAMRRILIEAARRKRRARHGGGRQRLDLDALAAASAPGDDLLALNDALDRLAAEVPAKAELVKLRYFAGLTLEEAAACLGISLATAKRRWAVARAWLYDALSPEDPPTPATNP
jgi:RNA polymerase sigma factor (TIGR02999 family)